MTPPDFDNSKSSDAIALKQYKYTNRLPFKKVTIIAILIIIRVSELFAL